MSDTGLRIVFLSNAPWAATGYGNQTGLFVPRFQRLGHQVAGLYYYGYAGQKSVRGRDTMYGVGQSQWGDDAVPYVQLDYDADIVISLMDVWVLDERIGAKDGVRFCPWLPVDHQPAPKQVLARLRDAYRPIAMSRFGQAMLHEQGVWADYIPHGVETRVLRPMRRRNRAYKRMLGFPDDCFLVGMVSANKGWPCRKAFPEAFEAFGDFNRRVPDARLYVHTIPDTRWGGPDLSMLAQDMGIDPYHVRFPMPSKFMLGFDQAFMARMYNAFDVLLCPSYGEGFGIPIVEAQACGTPVIVTDFSAMPELCGAGWTVDVARRWWTPLHAFQALPSIPHIAARLEEAYEAWRDPRERAALSERARAFALQYDADRVLEEAWRPWLEQVQHEVGVRHVANPRQHGGNGHVAHEADLPGLLTPTDADVVPARPA